MNLYEVVTHEKKYVTQDDALTTVFFQLPSHDWLILEKSETWHQVEAFLQEIQNTHMPPRPVIAVEKG